MSNTQYLIYVFLIMGLVTFTTRLIPFIVFKNSKEHPVLIFLGTYTPPAIMTILVIYSLKDISILEYPYGLKEILALLITTVVHLIRANPLLSIFSGTAFYMASLQLNWF